MKNFKFKKVSIIVLVAIFSLGIAGIIKAATFVNLGTADSFAILAGSGITNTGATTVTGNIGTFPTLTETGFGSVALTGTNHIGNAITQTAKDDLATAYTNAAGQALDTAIIADLGGQTLTPGVYNTASSIGITGTVTLNGSASDIWIFQAGSTLTTASNSHVTLTGGAQACNVFWQVGSSATIGTGSDFKGNILAMDSITDDGGSIIVGRFLARNAAVTLNNTTITKATCSGVVDPRLTLVKTITNDDGGTALITDWTLEASGTTPISGITGAVAVTNAVVTAGVYTLSETGGPTGYTASTYSCVKNGGAPVVSNSITLANSDTATCTITNTYIEPSRSSGSTLIYGCKDPNATNYNYFSSSKPELCVYGLTMTPTITILSTPVVTSVVPIFVPKLPKTGFAPQENYGWYQSLLNNILNLFR